MDISDFMDTAFMVLVIGPFALMGFAMFIHIWLAGIAIVGYLLLKPFSRKKAESFGEFMDDYI